MLAPGTHPHGHAHPHTVSLELRNVRLYTQAQIHTSHTQMHTTIYQYSGIKMDTHTFTHMNMFILFI